jgi:hypothetical protein
LTSISAFGGRPAGPLFADAQVDAVGQLEHSFSHSSSGALFGIFFFAIRYLKNWSVLSSGYAPETIKM